MEQEGSGGSLVRRKLFRPVQFSWEPCGGRAGKRRVGGAPEVSQCQPFRGRWRGKSQVHASESRLGTTILPSAPAIKGEETKPGWAQASPADRLLPAAAAGEDRERRHLREPEARRRLQVFALSRLRGADAGHVLLQEPRTVARAACLWTSDSTTPGSPSGLISPPPPASLPLFISRV